MFDFSFIKRVAEWRFEIRDGQVYAVAMDIKKEDLFCILTRAAPPAKPPPSDADNVVPFPIRFLD